MVGRPTRSRRRPASPIAVGVSLIAVGGSLIAGFTAFDIMNLARFTAPGVGLLAFLTTNLVDPLALFATLAIYLFTPFALHRTGALLALLPLFFVPIVRRFALRVMASG